MKLEVTGLDKLGHNLSGMMARAKNKERLFKEAGEYMVKTEIPLVFRQQGPGWTPPTTGGKALAKTGRLRDSFDYKATSNDLTVGTNVIYAGVHQDGKIIKPVNKDWLTIPAYSLSKSERDTFKLTNYENVFFKESKNGNLIAFQNLKDGKLKMLATLKKEVTIPQRKFLFWSDRALKAIARRWAKIIAKDEKP